MVLELLAYRESYSTHDINHASFKDYQVGSDSYSEQKQFYEKLIRISKLMSTSSYQEPVQFVGALLVPVKTSSKLMPSLDKDTVKLICLNSPLNHEISKLSSKPRNIHTANFVFRS